MSSRDFENRVVVVTGGASGMGAACVRQFAENGATVVIVDRNVSLATKMAEEVGASEPFVGDVADAAFCDRVIAETTQRNGGVDVLVNAAGVIVRARGEDTTDEQWHHIMGWRYLLHVPRCNCCDEEGWQGSDRKLWLNLG
jgi:meso-butanediol dehydrogenase / (S,S)-butanediol dehydrogenase / diacetyl reductase